MEQVIMAGWWQELTPVIYGFEICKPGHSFGPAVRHYYLLHFVLEGEGQFLKDGQIYSVKKGDIFVIQPGEVTTYRTGTENPWRYSWLGFRCGREGLFQGRPVIRGSQTRPIFTYIRDHHREENLDGKIFSLTYELLWQLLWGEEKQTGEGDSHAVYARTYIENAYMQPLRIQELADSMHIDRRYLTRQFRNAYGMPPQAYLMRLRLEKAAEFLSRGYSVTESALMAGFTDLSNFSRQFKSFYGVTPRQSISRQK